MACNATQHAHVPFSGKRAAAALLLSDGTWIPGVRVESASFSLTIPPALNAFTTAVAAGRQDIVAAAFSRATLQVERAFLNSLSESSFEAKGEDLCVLEGTALPPLGDELSPFLSAEAPAAPREGVAQAREMAERALVPASHFPVGCVLQVGADLVPGVNVEPLAADRLTDWSHVLCAERTALGTACSYGLLPRRHTPDATSTAPDETEEHAVPEAPLLYLSCPDDPQGSPCGACRQLLVELMPEGVLWMDRASGSPERATPPDLLPGSFRGSALPRSAPSA